MSADLSIHVFEGIAEQDLRAFFSNTLGSKYFRPVPVSQMAAFHDAFGKIADTPHVQVGEVSWLKAGLLDDPDEYIPNTVGEVHAIIGEDLPVVDDELIGRIRLAFELENTTEYEVAKPERVLAFLEQHRGKQVFTVSW